MTTQFENTKQKHNLQVYALLGGKTKSRLPVYSTTARPDIAQQLGFVGAKVPCPYGPADGDEGFRKNVEFFKNWRETVRLRVRENSGTDLGLSFLVIRELK